MAKKEVMANVEPGKYSVELKALELKIEQAKAKSAMELAKATEASKKALENNEKVKSLLESGLENLSEKFKLESVNIQQSIDKLEKEKIEKELELSNVTQEIDSEIVKIEKEHKEKIEDLIKIQNKKLADAKYEFEKDIRELGEAAFSKYLKQRNLTPVNVIELKDLQNYKTKTENEIQEMINVAVASAENAINVKIAHEREVEGLKHDNEINMLTSQIENFKKLVGKLEGMVSNYSKKDANMMSDIRDIVKEASRSVVNNITQDASE
jgi:hypothetical protein